MWGEVGGGELSCTCLVVRKYHDDLYVLKKRRELRKRDGKKEKHPRGYLGIFHLIVHFWAVFIFLFLGGVNKEFVDVSRKQISFLKRDY